MIYAPLKMTPVYQEYLWGGERLKREFGKIAAPDITAESWELASRPDGSTRTADGNTIAELGVLDREGFWGNSCQGENFPLLVKLIDAKQNLSVQVHPSDETALAELGEQGKAEMWYIVDCEPRACIYYGFSKRVTRAEFLERVRDRCICQVLNRVPVSKGDVFYILPGTIHAIGAGILVAEIQQNSNTTFRVYDYQRLGANGELRPLHLERAAEVLNYNPVIPQECRVNSGVMFPEFSMEEMFTCQYFRAYCIDVWESVTLFCDRQSFQHVLCVEGGGLIRAESGIYSLRRGDSFFMPAALGTYKIEGSCRVLLSRV